MADVIQFDIKKWKEKDFQRNVVAYAKGLGWCVYHSRDSRQNIDNGWPDLVFLREGEIIFAELKTEKGELSKEQKKTLALLATAGMETYCYRPRHLEEIRERLSRPLNLKES